MVAVYASGSAWNRRNIAFKAVVAERIELLWPIDGDRCDLVLDGIVDELIGISF